MGTKKFKLSDMIPNAWFYKLKDMNKTSKTHNKNKHNHNHNNHLLPPPPPPSSTVKTPPRPDPQCPSRKSYYVTRELTIDLPNEIDSTPPRKSRSRKSNRRSSSISTCSIPSSLSPPFRSYQSPPSPPSPKETDILGKDVGFFAEDALLDVHKQSILSRYALADEQNQPEHFDINIGVDRMSLHTTSIDLPPIITKQKPKPKPNAGRTSTTTINSPGGVRLRMNSPRIAARKQGQNGHKIIGRKSTSSKKRRSISESFAVVKTSFDPQGDFKESMVEMVLQNNLTAAKDLEDLLACYLSLNSDEYHDVIIKVFKQIWIDLRRRQ